MKPVSKLILISTLQGVALALLSYGVDLFLASRDIPSAGTLLDNLLIGLFAGTLAFVVATHTAERTLRANLAEQAKSDAVMEERNRLSREIHDTTAQGLTGIILQLEAAEETLSQNPEEARGNVISARDLARESLREVRASVWNLHSHSLENVNLQNAIEKVIQQTLIGLPIDVSVSSQGTVQELPEEIEFHLLRISQEAMTNAIKHAQASKIRVELSYAPSHVQLSIQDNGRGFVLTSPRTQGLGLISMNERAERLGGECSIQSSPGEGTRIQVVVPVPAGRQDLIG